MYVYVCVDGGRSSHHTLNESEKENRLQEGRASVCVRENEKNKEEAKGSKGVSE